MKKTFLSIFTLAIAAMPVLAQESTSVIDESINPIITAFPSLTITPDAKAGGMGGAGVATAPDLNSQHWNPAKYAFMESHGGITASYTPWLRKLVGDIDLAYIAGYYKWDDVQGISGSFTYFSLGSVELTTYEGSLGTVHPNEWAIDLAYSRKLHEYVSMAVAARFMYSDLTNGSGYSTGNDATPLKAAPMGAADIAVYYRQPFELPMGTSVLSAGIDISNLGGKISYDQGNNMSFIPANLRLGMQYELPINQYNYLSFALEVNKMMVPSRKSRFAVDADGNKVDPQTDNQYIIKTRDWYNELNSMVGLFQSFADAPGGAAEEFKECQWSAGLEYNYDHKFFGRVGYSHEDARKGNRQFVTFGAGFHLSIFSLDAAYYLATAPGSAIDNTFQVTLGFDLAGIKDLVKN